MLQIDLTYFIILSCVTLPCFGDAYNMSPLFCKIKMREQNSLSKKINFTDEIFCCQSIIVADLWFNASYQAQLQLPLLSVVLQSSIHTCQSCKVIILHLATTYQLFAHTRERKVASFMLLSSPIIVLFFLKFLWHPFSIVALRFNLETIISPPLTEVLQVKKVVI